MSEDEHRRTSLALSGLVRAFELPPHWPVTIRKAEGDVTMNAGELVRRIEKRYGRE